MNNTELKQFIRECIQELKEDNLKKETDKYIKDLPSKTDKKGWEKLKKEIWSDYTNVPTKYRKPDLANSVIDKLLTLRK